MIRDDAATHEAIELYLLVNENGPIMPTIERIAARLRLLSPPAPSKDSGRLSPPDDDPAARRCREGLIQPIESV
jgi:hypothetical protein